jgi:serpin B
LRHPALAEILLWPPAMRATHRLFLAASTSLAVLAGCSASSTSPSDPSKPSTPSDDGTVVASQQSRIMQPSVPDADATALRDGNTAFAADLYQTLRSDPDWQGKNVFFSPYSISLALAMAYAGAHGNTETQMASAMHYTLPQAKLHPALDALDLALASRGQGAKGDDGKAFRLRVTNSMWGAPQTTFAPAYLDTIAQNYGAGIRLTDFAANPEAARGTINSWVDKETDDRIKELLPVGSIDEATRLVLVNAIYFNAAWQTPFEKALTQAGTFHGIGGDSPAQLMRQGGELAYAKGTGWQAVSLPYDGNELSFIAVLPDQFSAFESAFSAEQASSIASSLASKPVELELPKFKIEGASFSLKKALVARGMTDAFDDTKADLSGITATERLHVSDVVHQAFVSVDEAGTEAAAATAVVSAGTAAPTDPPVKLTIDRPFVFFVRDNATGAILFLGRVVTM